jgi:FkbM family methyltransferase
MKAKHITPQNVTLVQPLKEALHVNEKNSFQICNKVDNNTIFTSHCTPCPVNAQTIDYMAVDANFNLAYWEKVDFIPVIPFWINIHDPNTQDIYISGSIHKKQKPWDVFIWELILRTSTQITSTNKLFVDVGANIGYFSLLAASLGYKVIAFEPMSRNAAKFYSSIVRNNFSDKITLFQNAVTAESGRQLVLQETHYTNQGNGKILQANIRIPDFSFYKYGVDYAESVMLSQMIHENILLMKIDVEGFESFVLDGGGKVICKNIVKYITMELSKDTITNSMCSVFSMFSIMRRIGYSISDVIPFARDLHDTPIDKFPPNILFTLIDASVAPIVRLQNQSPCDF